MSHLCVNTLPAGKVTLISHECISVISLEAITGISSQSVCLERKSQ